MKKSKLISKIALIVISLVMVTSIFAACSSKSNSTSGTKSSDGGKPGQPVKLIWYMPLQPMQDDAAVFAAANKIIKQKLNVVVDFEPMDPGDYDTKMNQIAASGQQYDIAWTSSWLFNYEQNAMKNAFVPITDEMLTKDAPAIKNTVPQKFLDSLKVNGKLYAVPNYGIAGSAGGFNVQTRFADKYNLDPSSIHSLTEMTPFFQKIKENEPNEIPLGINGGFYYPEWDGYWELPYGAVKMNDPKHKVVSIADIPGFKSYLNTMHSWYEKGYINQDAGTVGNKWGDEQKTGKFATTWLFTIQPGEKVAQEAYNGGNKVTFVQLAEPIFNGLDSATEAISATSNHPDLALKVINLVDTDPDLYNILNWGLENKDYTKIDDQTIKPLKDAKYNTNNGWVFGGLVKGSPLLQQGQPKDLQQQIIDWNKKLKISPYTGFSFDQSNVKTEMANLSNVDGKYNSQLYTGVIDPVSGLAQYKAALKTAGVDKVIAEEQKQLDAWFQKKGN